MRGGRQANSALTPGNWDFPPILRDPATWRHPLVARHADPLLRADLLALADRIGPLLEALDRLPHTLVHGDAGPMNLLVPADGSAEFVAVDWSWPHSAAVGFDLGQLLVGRAHTGELDPADLPEVHEAIEAAYAAATAGIADPGEVSFGYVAGLVLRSAWTAIPFELLDQEPTPSCTTCSANGPHSPASSSTWGARPAFATDVDHRPPPRRAEPRRDGGRSLSQALMVA
ncbi:hypothetical protein [Nonomuraea helvata]|uniref:Aminoglycoside phosphotransferase domain-containing protein n=1 Tax=Nonomuraea helvata TaxID=37484 RepID=A0ABV5RTH9_9ACTN